MEGSKMRWFRQQHGWTVQELANLLGTHEQTIRQYERGMRYKDRQAVEIPRTVELALLALWAGFRCFEDAFRDEASGHADPDVEAGPLTEVSPPIRDGIIRLLEKRGVNVGDFTVFLPWARLRPVWYQIEEWRQDHFEECQVHPVLRPDVPNGGVVVIEFADLDLATFFKMRWMSSK